MAPGYWRQKRPGCIPNPASSIHDRGPPSGRTTADHVSVPILSAWLQIDLLLVLHPSPEKDPPTSLYRDTGAPSRGPRREE